MAYLEALAGRQVCWPMAALPKSSRNPAKPPPNAPLSPPSGTGSTRACQRAGDPALGSGTTAPCFVPGGKRLVVTTDFSLENVHFRRDWHPPSSVGHRCLARGLERSGSDGRASGSGFPLLGITSLTLTRGKPRNSWLQAFLGRLHALGRTLQGSVGRRGYGAFPGSEERPGKYATSFWSAACRAARHCCVRELAPAISSASPERWAAQPLNWKRWGAGRPLSGAGQVAQGQGIRIFTRNPGWQPGAS